MNAIEEAVARTQIAHTMSIYNIHVDLGDVENILPAFAADAIFDTRSHVSTGHDQIRAFFDAVLGSKRPDADKPLPLIRHNLTTSLIRFTGDDRATGRTYFTVTSAHGIDHTGVYSDEFRKQDGRWVIAVRRIAVDYYATPSWYAEKRLKAVQAAKQA